MIILDAESLFRFVERYADTGDKHAFNLKDGRECFGWVTDVTSTALSFMWAPSPFHAQATGTDQMAPPDDVRT